MAGHSLDCTGGGTVTVAEEDTALSSLMRVVARGVKRVMARAVAREVARVITVAVVVMVTVTAAAVA
jgi:hypothetical protein